MTNPLVTSDPAVMLGKPVIAGTRITVELILEKFAAGETIDDLLLDYPQLTRETVVAAVQALRKDVVDPQTKLSPAYLTFGKYPGNKSTVEDFKDAEWHGEEEFDNRYGQ